MTETVLRYNGTALLDTEVITMKSLQIAAPNTFHQIETKIPQPGPHQVRIRLEGCGLSSSSLSLWEGRPWLTYPQERGSPGHEGFGIIDAVGEEVSNFKEGDRVTGLLQHAFADYDIANASEVVKIPDSLKYMPLPGEPLGQAINIFKRSEIYAGKSVAIIGIGFLGALLIQLAKSAGARVIAVSQRPFSLEVASAMGAHDCVLLEEGHKTEKRLHQLTSGHGCYCVIEATGKQLPLDLASRIVQPRGKIIIAGCHHDGIRHVNLLRWNLKGIDIINAYEPYRPQLVLGMQEALTAIEQCRLDITPLLTHYYTPDRIEEAFKTMAERPEGFVKAILQLN